MAQLTDMETSWFCQGRPETCVCDYHAGINREPRKEYELYKGFRIYSDKYFIEESDMDLSKQYFQDKQHLIEANKETNRKSYLMNSYYGNKSIKDAIDVYIEHKDLQVPKQPNSLVFDHWFNELKLDVKSFQNTFKVDRLDGRFSDFKDHFDYWDDFRRKDTRMLDFLTNDKIQEFWDITKLTKIINHSKNKNFDCLV